MAAGDSEKEKGNAAFRREDYETALMHYDEAIEKAGNAAGAALFSNKAATLIKLESYDLAIEQCRKGLAAPDLSLELKAKIYRRMAGAYESQGKLEDAMEALKMVDQDAAIYSRLERLIREQIFGDYDLKSLLREAADSETPRLDHADYNGGVGVQWISKEKGKGLIARRDFAAGDLLFVCKAFEAIYDPERIITSLRTRDECASRIMRRISKSQDLAKLDEVQAATFDPARAEAILASLKLGFNDLPGEKRMVPTEHPPFASVHFGFAFGGCGVWILASFMNHSCVPNTIVFFVGDLMLVRAAKKIARGEELTTSYFTSRASYESRLAFLENNFGFTCECPLCVCDLKRVTEQPHFTKRRAAAVLSFEAAVRSNLLGAANAMFDAVEGDDIPTIHFPMHLAFEDRYDHALQDVYNTLGSGYHVQGQFRNAATAFELAYFAAVGNGENADSDTFSYVLRTRDEICICHSIATNYLLCGKVAEAKEYLGKLQ